jgi:hypothetical protein
VFSILLVQLGKILILHILGEDILAKIFNEFLNSQQKKTQTYLNPEQEI